MKIVIAGAGLAAQRCIQALRRRGHDGPITLLGDEGVLPYDRPPLSKERLQGAMDDAALTLRPARWYADHAVALSLADPAVALEPGVVRTASGAALAYDRLLVATGARPLPLPGAAGLANVHTLRTARDAAALGAALRPGARLVVAGAGFVGQEVAATARALGAEVTLVEAAPTPLHGPLGPRIGAWFADLHRAEGVDVRLGARIARFEAAGDRLERRGARRRRRARLRRAARGRRRPSRHGVARVRGPARGRRAGRRPRRHRAPGRVRRRGRRTRRSLGGGRRAGRRGGARDARARAAGAAAAELLERPVRDPRPVRRRRARRRRRSSSTAIPPRATSPPCSCATAWCAPGCSSAARARFPPCATSSTSP